MEAAKEPVNQCRYGANCYRKNPTHFKDYSHKHCMFSELYYENFAENVVINFRVFSD